jgi:hypothetical protein
MARAGITPRHRPETIPVTPMHHKTLQSIRASLISDEASTASERITGKPIAVRTRPAVAARPASKRPSVMSCRAMRIRPAPTATRKANSVLRPIPRASRIAVRLKSAMRRTAITAVARVHSAGRTRPDTASRNGSARNENPFPP